MGAPDLSRHKQPEPVVLPSPFTPAQEARIRQIVREERADVSDVRSRRTAGWRFGE